MLSFLIHMHLYSTLSFVQNIFSISDWPNLDSLEPAPQSAKKGKTGSKRIKRWPGGGRGGDVAEPKDMPLMLPFCDAILVSNVFMLTDSPYRGQYRALSISCSCNSGKDFKRWTRVDWRHQRISSGSTLSHPQTFSWPTSLRYSKEPIIQPVTNNFLGTMALRYSGVPSKSCKQARACGKWTIKASGISIWLAECSQSSCGPDT